MAITIALAARALWWALACMQGNQRKSRCGIHHRVGREADALHRHGGEPVGEHRADEQAGEGDRVEEIDSLSGASIVEAGDEGTEERQADEARGADGEALADGGGRVAGRVERVRLLAHRRVQLAHLGDAARVVAHRAVHVDGEGRREVREHPEGRERDAVKARDRVGAEDDG